MEIRRTDISLLQPRIFATLYERVDGGPMRTAADVSQKKAVGRYASQKNGRGQFWESRPELYGFYWVEVSTEVVRYRAQPHTLEMAIKHKARRYTPDRMDYLTGGRAEIIEVKDAYKAEKDPDYHAKLETARIVYANQGWSFRITTRDEIEAQPNFEAAKYIQSLRRTVVTPREEDLVLDDLARRGVATVGDLRVLFGSPVVGFGKLCALMVKRTIKISFENGLSNKTPVHPVLA